MRAAAGFHEGVGRIGAPVTGPPGQDGHKEVVGVDMRLTASSGVKLHIGNDDDGLGEKLADQLMRRLPSDATGTVVLGNTSPGFTGFDERADGIRGRFAGKLPGVLVLGPFDTQRDDEANLDQILHRQESEKARKEFCQAQIDSFVEDPSNWVRPLEQAR